MVPLCADLALSLDAVRPVENDPVAGAAIVRSNLLRPLERTIPGMGKADWNMGFAFGRADVIEMLLYVLDRRIVAIVIEWRKVGADQSALGAHAVVPQFVYEHRVVKNTKLF